MAKKLTAHEVKTYDKDGVVFPKRVVTAEVAAQFLSEWKNFTPWCKSPKRLGLGDIDAFELPFEKYRLIIHRRRCR